MEIINLLDIKEKLDKYDLFIVDFDGTIINSMLMWRHICPSFLEYKNVQTNDDVLSLFKSLTNLEIAKLMQERYFPDMSKDMVVEEFFSFIKTEYVKQTLKPKAISFLEEIKKLGKVILYTATAMRLIDELLDLLDIRKYYDEIYSGSDMGWAKRDGSGYLKLIDLLGAKDLNILVVEDAPHAVIGANSVGLDVLVVEDYSNINFTNDIKNHTKYYINLFN